jgi:hypothetical protein
MAGGAVKAIKQFAMGIQATIGVIYNTKPIIVQRWTFFTAMYYLFAVFSENSDDPGKRILQV